MLKLNNCIILSKKDSWCKILTKEGNTLEVNTKVVYKYKNIMNTVWKDIPEYEGIYQASTEGDIRSIAYRKNKLLKPGVSNSGYNFVILSKDSDKKSHLVHRLMAKTFMDSDIDSKPNLNVDHKDNDKLNNKLSNLQIITSRRNATKDRKSTSIFPGVSYFKQYDTWRADININGDCIYLGQSQDEHEAANLYMNALKNVNNYNGNKKVFRELIRT